MVPFQARSPGGWGDMREGVPCPWSLGCGLLQAGLGQLRGDVPIGFYPELSGQEQGLGDPRV